MSEGRRSQVVLLDERRLDIIIQSRLYAGELLDIVSSHFNLKEKEYFGICFINEQGQHSWLQLDKRVLEHEFPKKSQNSVLVFYFRVKYFVESITQLQDSATIEAFYLQTKSLISKGDLEVESDIIFQLAALVIQATYGDYTDEQTFKSQLKRLPVLPTSTLKEFSSISACEKQVLEHYKALLGQNRGAAIVNYLSIIESLPTYGQHYYDVKDKAGNACWLTLSYRGISQYDKNDRRNPQRVFLWKQLENLYFRDRKFTVEVHEARRVVHTLSSFNLYEDAIEEPIEEFDELSNAICDPTTQVSVSRRALAPASVTVYVWYATSPSIAKCIWSMAIAQHQFFLDRSSKPTVTRVARSLNQIASELCHSVQSLSSASTNSNISRSNSATSLPNTVFEAKSESCLKGELSEESKAATLEMLAALSSRRDALQDALRKKTEELKALCLKEGDLTGELPPETPFQPGEIQPQLRRRVGTSFTISDKVFFRSKGRETINNLELDYEIQSKITSAALKLANDVAARKSVRKVRKVSYQQAATKLRDIEEKLSTLKRETDVVYKDNKVVNSSSSESNLNRVGLPVSSSETLISERGAFGPLNSCTVLPSISLPHLSESTSSSAPPSPSKRRHRHQSLQHMPPAAPDDIYEDVVLPFNPNRSRKSSYSTHSDYDVVSCGGSSVASLGIPYRNRFEDTLDIEGTNHYSVPNRRASQVFSNDPDDSHLDQSQDNISHHVTQRRGYVNTPLSCSFEDRLTFNKSPACLSINDPNFDNISIDNATLIYKSTEMPYIRCESVKPEHFNRPFTESTLHRTRSGSLQYKINNFHISEPDLNNESGSSRSHLLTVPKYRNTFRSMNNNKTSKGQGSEYPSGISNQTINQVVDLVQASVLLQDSKRAVSSNSLNNSTKPKTKEWIETSLDSPIVSKKRKNKVSEYPPKQEQLQPAQWFENGLPPVPTFQDSFQQGYMDESSTHNLNDQARLQTPEPAMDCHHDYANLQPEVFYSNTSTNQGPLHTPADSYRHYENLADLSNSSAAAQSLSVYENVSSPSNLNRKLADYNQNTETVPSIVLSVAQPQEPPKHPIRRMNVGECYTSDRDFQDHNESLQYNQEIPHRNAPTPLEYQENTYQNTPMPLKKSHQNAPAPLKFLETTTPLPFQENTYQNTPMPLKKSHQNVPSPMQFQETPAPMQFQEKCHQNAPAPLQFQDISRQNPLHCDVTDHTSHESQKQEWQHFPASPVAEQPLNSPGVEVNVVSVGHFQPYWEETKPYEISDFYKYSTKHRSRLQRSNKVTKRKLKEPLIDASNNSDVQNSSAKVLAASCDPVSSVSDTSSSLYDESSPTRVQQHEDRNQNISLGEMDLGASLADTFHDEMVAWYQNQDSAAKKATLV